MYSGMETEAAVMMIIVIFGSIHSLFYNLVIHDPDVYLHRVNEIMMWCTLNSHYKSNAILYLGID